MFTILALKNGSEGDKISKNTLSYCLTSFFLEILSPSSQIMGQNLKTWSRQIMFYTKNYHLSIHVAFWKESMINRLSNLINRNRSAAKISQVYALLLTVVINFMRHLRGFLRYNIWLYTNSCTFQYLSIETHHTEYMSAWISLEQYLVGQRYLLLQRV